MKKIVPTSKYKLLDKLKANDDHAIKFKINPEKKAHLENIVNQRRVKVANILREWLRKDKSFLTKNKKKEN